VSQTWNTIWCQLPTCCKDAFYAEPEVNCLWSFRCDAIACDVNKERVSIFSTVPHKGDAWFVTLMGSAQYWSRNINSSIQGESMQRIFFKRKHWRCFRSS
jgi:hypothetical protein